MWLGPVLIFYFGKDNQSRVNIKPSLANPIPTTNKKVMSNFGGGEIKLNDG